METHLTPEVYYLFLVNCKFKDLHRLDNSIDYYDLLNYTYKKDEMIIVSQTRSAKILMIEERNFVVLRIIKKEGNKIKEY